MPDINPTVNDTMDRLASLSEQINTSNGFGMMGLLEQQQQQAAQATQPEQVAAPAAPAPVADDKVPQWIEPLNSSLRAIAETTRNEIGSLRDQVSSLRQAPVAPSQEEGGEIDPATQRLNQVESTLAQTRLNTAWERAKNSYNAAKMKYGNDFDFKEDDLKGVWRQHIGNNVQAAEGTNWDMYMQQQYDSRRAPKLEARLKDLESKLAAQPATPAQDPLANMGALPRANRNGAPMPTTGVVKDFDEDVYRSASARMGKRIGSFAGFNRLLVDEQQKKLLRTAR